MIIQSGLLQMKSDHKYEKTWKKSFQHSTADVVLTAEERNHMGKVMTKSNVANLNSTHNDETNLEEGGFLATLNYRLDAAAKQSYREPQDLAAISEEVERDTEEPGAKGLDKSNKSALDQLLEGKNHEQQMQTLGYLLLQILYGRLSGNYDMDLTDAAQDYLQKNTYTIDTYEATSVYSEQESYTFETTGTVVTADGREINFGVTVGMSRSFYQENHAFVQRISSNTLDPLVLNVDADVTSVSDQRFYFDLNGDGEEEYISKLGAGCGFLALDKNGDGIINDGTELFGPNMGDGFEELQLFDTDGNGWIDEADPIFHQLKIWEFDENGDAVLYSLKDKQVGAICLQRMETPFHLKDNTTNTTNGIIQETGVFLTEAGMARTIQHMDYVV